MTQAVRFGGQYFLQIRDTNPARREKKLNQAVELLTKAAEAQAMPIRITLHRPAIGAEMLAGLGIAMMEVYTRNDAKAYDQFAKAHHAYQQLSIWYDMRTGRIPSTSKTRDRQAQQDAALQTEREIIEKELCETFLPQFSERNLNPEQDFPLFVNYMARLNAVRDKEALLAAQRKPHKLHAFQMPFYPQDSSTSTLSVDTVIQHLGGKRKTGRLNVETGRVTPRQSWFKALLGQPGGAKQKK